MKYKGQVDESSIEKFWAIFCCNRDKYVVHKPPFSQEGHKMKASRVCYALENPGSGDKTKKKLTIEDFKAHLYGQYGVAVEPLRDVKKDGKNVPNMCYYGIIDIDVYDTDFIPLIKKMYGFGLKFVAVRSKSGGLHIYFVMKEATPAKAVRQSLRLVVEKFGMDAIYSAKGASKVEIFPMHDTETPGADGKCVFLPYFNVAGTGTQNYIYGADGNVVNFIDALSIIERNYTSTKEIDEAVSQLPYSDAPYCIQAVALTGALGENEGRNKFLFHSCVYLKRKFGAQSEWYDELLKLDSMLASPLQDENPQELEDTYRSSLSKDWSFSCRQEPMCSYCNKEICAKRKFSGVVKRTKENDNTGADFLGPISRVMARVPYYLWEIAPPGKDAKEVRFDSIGELANQSVVQQHCWDQLGWAPLPIKPGLWVETVNTCMEGIENRQIEITDESDTSELSELHSLIVGYLTHGQVQNGARYMVNVGQVYYEDSVFYFTTDGLKQFLRVQKFNLGRTNLREELLKYGCRDSELAYTMPSGRISTIKCWAKDTDSELEQKKTYFDDVLTQDAERAKELNLPDKDTERLEDWDEENSRF